MVFIIVKSKQLIHTAESITAGWAVYVFGMSVHTHKELAHRTTDLHPALRHTGRALTWLSTGFDSHKFAINHRIHHAIADGPEDRLSISRIGRISKLFKSRAYAKLSDDQITQHAQSITFGNELAEDTDPVLAQTASGAVIKRKSTGDKVFEIGLLGPAIFVGAGALVKGRRGALNAATTLATVASVSSLVNVFGHDARGTGPNNTGVDRGGVANIVTAGESYHRNHHQHPDELSSAPEGRIDIAAGVVHALAYVGLASIRD